jgi:hypothetical protein
MRWAAASKMKIAFKAILVMAVFAIVVAALSLSWFYFYSRDLPDFAAVANFAPDSTATVADRCSTSAIRVIRYCATNLGFVRYAGRIREGYRPHPRHWEALAKLVGVSR